MTNRLERLNEGPASKGAGPFFSCQIEMEGLKRQAMQAAMLEHYIGDEACARFTVDSAGQRGAFPDPDGICW